MWIAALVSSQVRLRRARRRGIAHELELRRRLGLLLGVEHAALAAAVLTGFALMALHGWRPGYPRWLSLKLGLVVFLLLPLEGMHAWVNHVWIARALPRSRPRPPRSRASWTAGSAWTTWCARWPRCCWAWRSRSSCGCR